MEPYSKPWALIDMSISNRFDKMICSIIVGKVKNLSHTLYTRSCCVLFCLYHQIVVVLLFSLFSFSTVTSLALGYSYDYQNTKFVIKLSYELYTIDVNIVIIQCVVYHLIVWWFYLKQEAPRMRKPPRIVNGAWNSLVRCKTAQPIVSYVISNIFRKFTKIHSPSTMLVTNAHPENKNNHVSRGLNATLQMLQIVLVWYQTYPVNSMKIHSAIFP